MKKNNPGTHCKNPPENLHPSAPSAEEEYKGKFTNPTRREVYHKNPVHPKIK